MTRLCLALIGLAFVPLSASTVGAQTRSVDFVVAGHVVSVFGLPISGAEVGLLPGNVRVTTDSTGQFRILAPRDVQKVVVRRIGFAPRAFDISPSSEERYQLDVVLEPRAVRLPDIQVTARNAVPARYARTTRFDDFYRRRLWGRGTFFTRDDIEAKQPMETIDLLRGVPGVRVATMGPGVADQASMAFARCSGPDSKVSVWIDGNKMNLYANAKGARGRVGGGSAPAGGGQEQNSKAYSREMEDDVHVGPIQALMEISPLDIEAMEVYRGVSQIPGEFLDDSCAVIVMWSRHR